MKYHYYANNFAVYLPFCVFLAFYWCFLFVFVFLHFSSVFVGVEVKLNTMLTMCSIKLLITVLSLRCVPAILPEKDGQTQRDNTNRRQCQRQRQRYFTGILLKPAQFQQKQDFT